MLRRSRYLVLFVVVVLNAMSPALAVFTKYSDEAAYLADLAMLGYSPASDNFEGNNFWGLLETDSAPDVTSHGVTWSGLGGGLTLDHQFRRSGAWGLESFPPGSPFDGFRATPNEPLFAFGGWVRAGNSGAGGANDLLLFLNDNPAQILDTSVDSNYSFIGVIETDGISSIQFETEPVDPPEPGSGDPIDPSKTIFLDDFTYGFANAPSLREPGIAWTNASGGDYTTGGNWSSGAFPAVTNNALFHLSSVTPYTVNFTQFHAASQAVIANDRLSIDLGGFGYNLTEPNITRESLIVAERPGDIGELTLLNGTLSGVNAVVAHSSGSTGHLTIETGANLFLTGTMRIGSGGNGTLDISTGGVVTSGGSSVDYGGIIGQLNGNGTVNVSSAGARWDSTQLIAVGLGGTGILNISDGAAVSASQLIAGSKAGNGLGNEPNGMGTINVSGTGTTLSGNIIIAQDGPASMNVTNGAQLTGSGGTIAVSSDADVVLDGPGTSWNMNIPGSSQGTLQIGPGDQKGTFASFPPRPLHTGTLTIQNGASVQTEATYIGLTRTGRGVLTVTGINSLWTSGSQFSGNTFIGHDGDGELNVLAGGSVQTGQAFIGRLGLRDQLRGVANIDGAGSNWTTPSTIWIGYHDEPQIYIGAATFFAEGQLHVSNGGSVNAGQLSLAGRKVSKGVVNIKGAGSVITANSVTFGKTFTSTFTFGSNAEMTIANGGLLDVTSNIDLYHGILTLDGGTINTTNLQLHGEQLIDPGSQSETGDTRVTLIGTGQINGNVNNGGGFVSPGQSVGLLNISGDYSQAVDGTLSIELGGTDNSDTLNLQYDQLVIEGFATLEGTLEVSLFDPGTGLFAPSMGDSFDILTATGAVTGTFDNQNLPALSGGLSWGVLYGTNTVTLAVLSATLPGDYNADGTVDAADYTVWRDTLGQSGAGLTADGDGSGIIDAGDYGVWVTNFGMSSPMGTSLVNSAVPEPGGVFLVILGVAFLISYQELVYRRSYES